MGLFEIRRKDKIELNGVEFNYVTKQDELFIKCLISDNKLNSWNLNYENIIAYNTESWQNIIYKIIDNVVCFFCYYPNKDGSSDGRILDFAFKPLKIDTSIELNLADVMLQIKEILLKVNKGEKLARMVYLSELDKDYLKEFVKPHKVKSFNEFVYNLEYLNKIEGSRFKNVRRDFNRFERDYPNVRLVPYEKSKHKTKCILLLNLWEDDYKRRWKETPLWKNSMLYYFDNLENTETSHAYVLIDGEKVIGYMNAVYMFDDYCCCIKRISNNTYTNSSNYLLISTIRKLYELGYRYMNDGNAGGDTEKSLGGFKTKYVKEDEQYQFFLYSGTFK